MTTLRQMINLTIIAGLMLWPVMSPTFAADPTASDGHPTPNSKPRDVSHAYPGHGFNQDLENTLHVYPDKAGTRIDDCRLCHIEGVRNNRRINNCDFCHMVYEKEGYAVTLNAYGIDFNQAGRSKEAVESIRETDSDKDGVTNDAEIKALCYPGEASSKPGLPDSKSKNLSAADLKKMPGHTQFLLMNASKHTDYYATYGGWTIESILKSAGIPLDGVTGITVFSVDGYRKDISIDEIRQTFPAGVFHTKETLKVPENCPELIRAPEVLPDGVKPGEGILNPLRVMLASDRDGIPMKKLGRNEQGKLEGEGNYRLILPERNPSPPDQSSKNPPSDCPYPYTYALHHNAGDCARGVVAIRIDPVPEGFNETDWLPKAQGLLDSQTILLFGHGQD